jgi:hypothetical protein
VKPARDYRRILAAFVCSAFAAIAGIFLPLIIHGVRNLPWEFAFGFAYYVTGFFRGSELGERLDGFIGGIVWPLAIIVIVWFAASRLCTAGTVARLAWSSFFVLSLAICVPAETANSLAARIPLFLNESSVRY